MVPPPGSRRKAALPHPSPETTPLIYSWPRTLQKQHQVLVKGLILLINPKFSVASSESTLRRGSIPAPNHAGAGGHQPNSCFSFCCPQGQAGALICSRQQLQRSH